MDLNNKITSSTRGVALVVTIGYEGEHKLEGTDKDGKKAEIFFLKCNYAVSWYHDITATHFLSLCNELSAHEYPSTCKRLVVVFSGHGVYDKIEFFDGKMVSVSEMVNEFKLAKNATLGHMARIFFIDACRGDEEDEGEPCKRATGLTEDKGPKIKLPNDSNILVAFATPASYVSLCTSMGSDWLNCVFEALEEDPNEDLLGALTNANKKLKKYYINGEHHQIGIHRSSTFEKIYFLKEAGLVPFGKI